VASLDIPASYRLGQIAANLERLRWLPRSLGSRYIAVNVPAFELEAFENGKPALRMKVIVGSEFAGRRTPTFSDSMKTVVFRPYWVVPDTIAAKEIWPKAKADPGYLGRHGYEVVRIEGKTRIRQVPGDKNALGLVKFLFPNDYSVYLHDTAEGQLFQNDVRAYSHGCIRVERPAALASWVLGWPIDKVQDAMQSGRDDRQAPLSERIPVYITYLTTYSRDGELRFGNDLYFRDDALVSVAQRGAELDEATVRTIDSLRRIAKP
jgi:L,D-transpeptidase YcbB